ncbi:MAG: hypothetical protein QXU45_01465 [Candidatus Bathyarchaeia archaeon]
MELTEKEKAVIKSLAKTPKTEYELFEKERVASSSTVWKTARKLVKLGLIEVKRQEKFQKIPSEVKKYYGLTFRGLVYALKLGIHLNEIKYWQDIIFSWIQNANTLESFINVQEKLGIRADFSKIQSKLVEYIKQNPEQIETFLKHYDLAFSDDILICLELHSFIAYMEASSMVLRRVKKRELKRVFKNVPEHYKMIFFIPELWQAHIKGVSHE